MGRGPCTFKQRDVTSALKAAVAAGIEVARIEIDRDGKIVVVAGKPTVVVSDAGGERPNDWADAR